MNDRRLIQRDLGEIYNSLSMYDLKGKRIGLPPEFKIMKLDSIGINLMRGLCEEIGARFKIDSQNGTRVTVNFVYDPDITTGISLLSIQPVHS